MVLKAGWLGFEGFECKEESEVVWRYWWGGGYVVPLLGGGVQDVLGGFWGWSWLRGERLAVQRWVAVVRDIGGRWGFGVRGPGDSWLGRRAGELM